MITYRIGQAPNLPWWKIQNMTDEEIQKFNDGFMKEVIVGIEIEKQTQEQIDKMSKQYAEETKIWNAAIEAAAKELDTYEYIEGSADRIRELKK